MKDKHSFWKQEKKSKLSSLIFGGMKEVKPFPISSPKDKKQMNWIQGQKYSKNPFGDSDRDGIIDIHDCKPFNNKMQEPKPKFNKKRIGGNVNVPPLKIIKEPTDKDVKAETRRLMAEIREEQSITAKGKELSLLQSKTFGNQLISTIDTKGKTPNKEQYSKLAKSLLEETGEKYKEAKKIATAFGIKVKEEPRGAGRPAESELTKRQRAWKKREEKKFNRRAILLEKKSSKIIKKGIQQEVVPIIKQLKKEQKVLSGNRELENVRLIKELGRLARRSPTMGSGYGRRKKLKLEAPSIIYERVSRWKPLSFTKSEIKEKEEEFDVRYSMSNRKLGEPITLKGLTAEDLAGTGIEPKPEKIVKLGYKIKKYEGPSAQELIEKNEKKFQEKIRKMQEPNWKIKTTKEDAISVEKPRERLEKEDWRIDVGKEDIIVSKSPEYGPKKKGLLSRLLSRQPKEKDWKIDVGYEKVEPKIEVRKVPVYPLPEKEPKIEIRKEDRIEVVPEKTMKIKRYEVEGEPTDYITYSKEKPEYKIKVGKDRIDVGYETEEPSFKEQVEKLEKESKAEEKRIAKEDREIRREESKAERETLKEEKEREPAKEKSAQELIDEA